MKENICKENELISVVIPSYNRAHIIMKSIESVLNQTYRNIELIVVDDGSTDNTKEVLEQIEDDRFKYIKLEKNSGMCAARNVGTNLANGKFIAIHDSDDIWHKDKLEKQYILMKETESDLSFCKMRRIGIDKKERIVPNENIIIDGDIYPKLLKGNFIASITIMMKIELAKKIKFDPNVRRFTDWDFVLRVVKANYKISYLPEILATSYLQNDSTATISNSHKSIEFIYNRYKDDIEFYPDSNAIFLYNLGVTCSDNNRKLANKYLMDSLRIRFSGKIIIRLILINTGLIRLAKILKKRMNKYFVLI